MSNDYKKDAGKPPVHAAVLSTFNLALLALARMMDKQRVLHQLQGATNPYVEWQKLPDAYWRVLQAKGRHLLLSGPTADAVDTDGESHLLHELFNTLAAVQLQEQAKAQPCCGAPDGVAVIPAALMVPAGADWRELPHCPVHSTAQRVRNQHGVLSCTVPGCDWLAVPK